MTRKRNPIRARRDELEPLEELEPLNVLEELERAALGHERAALVIRAAIEIVRNDEARRRASSSRARDAENPARRNTPVLNLR